MRLWETGTEKEIKRTNFIGKGGFGTVHKGKHLGMEIAVKRMIQNPLIPIDLVGFESEIKVFLFLFLIIIFKKGFNGITKSKIGANDWILQRK